MPSFESERASLYGQPGDDRMLFVRNGRSTEPQPDVAALLAQLIEGQAEINRRLDAIEAAQERRFAEAIDAARCADLTAEEVCLLVRDTVIPNVQYTASCARNIEDVVIDMADVVAPIDTEGDADVVPLTNIADNADTPLEDPK